MYTRHSGYQAPSGTPKSSDAITPPGRNSAPSVRSVSGTLVTYRSRYPNVSPSNDPSRNGGASAEHSTSSRVCARVRRASNSIGRVMSAPTTSKPRARSSAANAPVPVAISSTRDPGGSLSRETTKRCHARYRNRLRICAGLSYPRATGPNTRRGKSGAPGLSTNSDPFLLAKRLRFYQQ